MSSQNFPSSCQNRIFHFGIIVNLQLTPLTLCNQEKFGKCLKKIQHLYVFPQLYKVGNVSMFTLEIAKINSESEDRIRDHSDALLSEFTWQGLVDG